MNWMARGAAAVLLTAGGTVARRFLTARGAQRIPTDEPRGDTAPRHAPKPRWHVVTVNRSLEEVQPGGRLPGPLGELGDRIDVQVRRAAGDRGTEIAARLRDGEPTGVAGAAARVSGQDPRQELRSALRQTKQLLETGEVLSADRPTSTRRTITSLPLELATRRAGGEGRL